MGGTRCGTSVVFQVVWWGTIEVSGQMGARQKVSGQIVRRARWEEYKTREIINL